MIGLTHVYVMAQEEVDPDTVMGLFNPDGIAAPQTVTLVGTVQTVMGCARNWDTRCAESALTYIPEYDLWYGEFELPAGHYHYKAVLDGGASYGQGATLNGRIIPLKLDEARWVMFYYDHNTGWIMDSVNAMVVALKSFTTRACLERDDIGEFAQPCMHTLMQDQDGDGIYIFQTPHLTAGEYNVSVVVEPDPSSEFLYYGEDGAPGGPYIPFTVPAERTLITFTWDSQTKLLDIQIGGYVPLSENEVVVEYCEYPCE